MGYNMKIVSKEPVSVFNNELRQDVIIEVGCKYYYKVAKPTNKKDRTANGRTVEILGFSDNFCGDAIVRYLDNNMPGRLRCNHLVPCEAIFTNYEL